MRRRLIALLVVDGARVGVRGRAAPSARAGRRRAPATGTRRCSTSPRRCRRAPTTPNTRSSSSGRRRTRRATTSRARASSSRRISSTRRSSSTRRPSRWTRSNRLAATRGGRARADHPRPHREVASAPRDREAAAAGAGAGRARAQPGRSHAAQDQLQQLEPARHPQLHRHDDRHQRSVRRAYSGQGVHGQPRRRHARGGAPADPVGQRLLLQGAQPDDDRRSRRTTRPAT